MKILHLVSFIALICPFACSIDNVVRDGQSLSERMFMEGQEEHGTPKSPVEGEPAEPKAKGDVGTSEPAIEGDSPSLFDKSVQGVKSFVSTFKPSWSPQGKSQAQRASDYQAVRATMSITWGPEIKPMLVTNEDGSHVGNMQYGITPNDFKEFETTTQRTENGGIVYKFKQPQHYGSANDPSTIHIIYQTRYFTPLEGSGMTTLSNRVGLLMKRFHELNQYGKRGVQLEQLTGTTGNQGSTQNSQAEFINCINALAIVQDSIEGLLTPTLKTLVAKYNNNTFINTMAQSVYLDLTGSTTSLIGPFNYGMSYMNTSVTDTAPSANSANTTVQPFLVLQKIYTEMWVEANKAANSTGLLTQQATLVGYLQTNDTSLYPANFQTVNQNANVPSFL